MHISLFSRIHLDCGRHPPADVPGAGEAVRAVRLEGPHCRGLRRRLLCVESRGGVHRGAGAALHGHQGHPVRGSEVEGRGARDCGAGPACLSAVRGLRPALGQGATPAERPQAGQVREHVTG